MAQARQVAGGESGAAVAQAAAAAQRREGGSEGGAEKVQCKAAARRRERHEDFMRYRHILSSFLPRHSLFAIITPTAMPTTFYAARRFTVFADAAIPLKSRIGGRGHHENTL